MLLIPDAINKIYFFNFFVSYKLSSFIWMEDEKQKHFSQFKAGFESKNFLIKRMAAKNKILL
jgi:hypothetical protein